MAVVVPFCAMRFGPDAGNPEKLVCPPYDIISEEERLGYLAENEHNIIRLELPREGENPYLVAGQLQDKWLRDGILKIDKKPAVYVYEIEFKYNKMEYEYKIDAKTGKVIEVEIEED